MVPQGAERAAVEDLEATSLRSTDVEVLRSLGADEALAFSGLRRKMHVHQEKLSRALHRLEEEGLVSRTERGYALTPKGAEVACRLAPVGRGEMTTVLRSYLPASAAPAQVAESLEGRWFGNLRWLGRRDAEGGTQLMWTTFSPEVEVVLRLLWGEAMVETDASDPEGMAEAFQGARHILAQLDGPRRRGPEEKAATGS